MRSEGHASEPLDLPPPATEMGAAVALALECADEADTISLASFRQAVEVRAKPDRSFVTAADEAVEQAIRARITVRFPDHGFVGEEYGEQPAASGRRWFIDPIDGTHNYMRGVPVFATLLALEVDGQLQLGVVSAPALHRRWFAWRGGGAWAVDLVPGGWTATSASRLQVSNISDIGLAHVLYSSVPGIARSGLAPGFGTLLDHAWRDRGLGDFWGYMLVAEGAAEVMLEAELAAWDLAGPRAVLEEAGGRVSDLRGGGAIPVEGVLATNGHIHDAIVEVLRGRGQGPA